MLTEVTGDILLTKAQAIAHGVAPNDSFSTGLALSLRERWPAMYKDFRHYYQLGHPKSGRAWGWVGADGKRIVNLFTQEAAPKHGGHPGRATLENLNHALRELYNIAEKEKFSSLALPRLATGVGGLDWYQVKPLIVKHLGNLQIPVIIYVHYSKGVAADEKI
ncbi:MAG: macro domain-containing protein [Deltaproteobacteria bacterium]|nr:macro domain-containing protein [Deltaproteobacteria bacterium]